VVAGAPLPACAGEQVHAGSAGTHRPWGVATVGTVARA